MRIGILKFQNEFVLHEHWSLCWKFKMNLHWTSADWFIRWKPRGFIGQAFYYDPTWDIQIIMQCNDKGMIGAWPHVVIALTEAMPI